MAFRHLKGFFRHRAAKTELARRLANKPGYSTVEVQQVWRATPLSAVYAARLGGRDVVLKLYLTENADEMAAQAAAELTRMSASMAIGEYRVVHCLQAEPEIGLVVLERAPGENLASVLHRSASADRARLIRRSGEWLSRYTQERRRVASFGPGHWVKLCARTDLSSLARDEAALLADMLQVLEKRSGAHSGRPVIQAATHADFTPLNLNSHQDVLYGFDIQGERWMAIARDLALYLLWVQGRSPIDASERICGIARADWDALLDCGVVPDDECQTTLPFFIGARLFEQLSIPGRKNARRRRLLKLAREYVETPISP